jgi:hypothetical protein
MQEGQRNTLLVYMYVCVSSHLQGMAEDAAAAVADGHVALHLDDGLLLDEVEGVGPVLALGVGGVGPGDHVLGLVGVDGRGEGADAAADAGGSGRAPGSGAAQGRGDASGGHSGAEGRGSDGALVDRGLEGYHGTSYVMYRPADTNPRNATNVR